MCIILHTYIEACAKVPSVCIAISQAYAANSTHYALSELKLQQDEILSKYVLIFSYGSLLLGNQMET